MNQLRKPEAASPVPEVGYRWSEPVFRPGAEAGAGLSDRLA